MSLIQRELDANGRLLLDAVVEAAQEMAVDLWLVGGAVRDTVLGLPLVDLDVAVAGDGRCAADLAQRTARIVGAEVRHAPRFATAAVLLDGRTLDVAALRRERYRRPGALPAVTTGAAIEDDLRRRDFSVNAVALGLAGHRRDEIVDPLGGMRDLAARRLRVLHARSFADDPTRLWRGARYAARLGLRPDPDTARRIKDGVRWLSRVSGRRLWAEFERTASERRVAAVLRMLERWGVLEASAPGLALVPDAVRALRHRRGPLPAELLAALLLAPITAREAVLSRLAAPGRARRSAQEAARLLALPDCEPPALKEAEGCGETARTAAMWLDPGRQRPLQRALRRWERTRPPLDGHALERMGVPRGPAVGRLLDRLRRERYLGTLSTASEARRLVRGLLQEEATR